MAGLTFLDLGAINGASRAPPALQDFFRGARQFPPGPLFFSPRMPCGSIFQQHFPQNDDTRTPQSQCLMAIPKTALGPDAPTSFEIPTTVEHTKTLPIASTFDKNPIKKGNILGFLAMRPPAVMPTPPGPQGWPGMPSHAQPCPEKMRASAFGFWGAWPIGFGIWLHSKAPSTRRRHRPWWTRHVH